MAASFSLPVTQDLFALRAKLQELLQFLREALSISNAHTVDFYTESVWEQLIDLPPEAVLGVLRKSAVEAEAEAEARVSEARLLSEAESPSEPVVENLLSSQKIQFLYLQSCPW